MKPADVLASFSDGDEMSQIRMLAKNWSLLSGGCLENTSGTFHFSSPHNGFKVLSICKNSRSKWTLVSLEMSPSLIALLQISASVLGLS